MPGVHALADRAPDTRPRDDGSGIAALRQHVHRADQGNRDTVDHHRPGVDARHYWHWLEILCLRRGAVLAGAVLLGTRRDRQPVRSADRGTACEIQLRGLTM